MATANVNITANPPSSGPADLAPPNPLALLWGGAMLILFALWLGKIEPQTAVPPMAPGMPEQVAVTAPSPIIVVGLWVLGGGGVLLGVWQFLLQRKAGPTMDQAMVIRHRQMVGKLLVAVGMVLAVLGAYLVWNLRLPGFGESVGLCLFAMIPLVSGINLQSTSASSDFPQMMLGQFVPLRNFLFVAGGAGLLCYLYLVFGPKKVGFAWFPELGALVFESLACITAGFWLATTLPQERTPFAMRCFLIALGGVTGLILSLAAFFRTIAWRDDIMLKGMGGWTSNNVWELWMCAYLGLAGLVLMFGSLLLARAEVRNHAVLRRAMFGYNALVSGLLLVLFLAVLNILGCAMFPTTYEWTQSGLVSLADSSKTILANLKNSPPITVYVLLSERSAVYSDMHQLLDNCQALAPLDKFKTVYVHPEKDSDLYDDLAQRFPIIKPIADLEAMTESRGKARGRGILLVQGALPQDAKGKTPPHSFIADRKLLSDERTPSGPKRVFRGENELMKDLLFLERGQKKRKVYVLQGEGELDINNHFRHERGDSLRAPMSELGCLFLMDHLVKDNYAVEGLNFGSPVKSKGKEQFRTIVVQESGNDKRKDVPDDAYAVLVLGPTNMKKDAVDALQRHMDRGGRMFVTLDVVLQRDPLALIKSGMEDLLRRHGVVIEDNFVLRYAMDDTRLIVGTAPEKSSNAIAKQFAAEVFKFETCRVVGEGPPGKYKAEVLLQADPGVVIRGNQFEYWVETDAQALLHRNNFLKLHGKLLELRKSTEPVPIAVAVTEESPKSDEPSRPRLIVFGDTEWLANADIVESRANYSLFVSCLEWLNERQSLGMQPKTSQSYTMSEKTDVWRMIIMPFWVMSLGIIGLGSGIWLVRRR